MSGRYETFIENHLDVRGRSGNEYVCRCIFHDDRGKPNMYVNGAKGVWICHSCGEKGGIHKLAQKLGVEIRDNGIPLSQLQGRLNKLTPMPRDRKVRTYPETWLRQFDFPHPFWTQERGFTPETVGHWKLGYDPIQDQAIIPFRHPNGDLMGVIRRRLDDEKPRYVYPWKSYFRKYLFGAWMVRTRKVALVEGPLDVIACFDARVPALGLMGSRLGPDQARLLRTMGVQTVVLMTDNDKAGREAAHQIKEELDGMIVKVGVYRPYWIGADPGELTPMQRRKIFHSAVNWSIRPAIMG